MQLEFGSRFFPKAISALKYWLHILKKTHTYIDYTSYAKTLIFISVREWNLGKVALQHLRHNGKSYNKALQC